MKPCSTSEVCYFEATILTNCQPLVGFTEIYGNRCRLPTGTPLHRALVTRSEPLGRSITVDGVELHGRRLILAGISRTLPGGNDNWISAGAASRDALSTRSMFARAFDCRRSCQVRISPGAGLNQSGPSDNEWVVTSHGRRVPCVPTPDPANLPGTRWTRVGAWGLVQIRVLRGGVCGGLQRGQRADGAGYIRRPVGILRRLPVSGRARASRGSRHKASHPITPLSAGSFCR